MGFYMTPSFFALSALVVLVSAVLGLLELPLMAWGLFASIAMLVLMFWGNLAAALSLALFLSLSIGSTLWLLGRPRSLWRTTVAVLVSIAPLVVYKLTVSLSGSGLLGFAGISYVTFKVVQVQLEAYDGLISKKDFKLWDYLYFLLFFPSFDSGPIDRSRRFGEDLGRRIPRDEYAGMLARGILLFMVGMVYKLVLAALAYRLYLPSTWGDGPFLQELGKQLACAYSYGLYLFFDFAGYSLMAMGLAFCLGVRLPRNFRAPFLARDLTDFWNRWHITLSTWLRDFVFMRLVRLLMKRRLVRGRLRTAQLALLADMLLMGLWHGVTVDYVAYGLYHGVLMALTEGHQKSAFYRRHRNDPAYRLMSWFVTLQLVFFGFALFSGQMSLLVKGALHV